MANVISVIIGAQVLTTSTLARFTFQIDWALGQRTRAVFNIFDIGATLTVPEINEAVRIVRFGTDVWQGTVDQIKWTFPGGDVRYFEVTCNGYERALDKRVLLNTNYSMVPVVPDAAGDSFEIKASSNPFAVNDTVQVRADTAIAAPLAAGTTYYVTARTSTHVQLAATQGGAAINITDIGVGQHHIMWTAGAIVKAIGLPSGEGISEGLIRPGVGIESFAAEYSAIWDLIDQLASASNYVAYIEPDLTTPKLYFVPKDEFTAPWDIDEDTSPDVLADPGLTLVQTREVYANRVYLLPAESIWPLTAQNLTGDGSKRIFETTFPIKDVLAITRAGSVQTVGVRGGSGSQWYIQPNSKYVYHDAGESVLGSGEIAVIQYRGIGTNATMAEDAGEQATYGLFESVLSAQSVASAADATTTAAAKLAASKVMGLVAEYSTTGAGLRPGQVQQIRWPSGGIASDTPFLIDKVTGKWVNGDLRYDVTAQSGTRIPGYVEVFRSFVGGTSTAGAVGGVGGSGSAAGSTLTVNTYTLTGPETINDAVGSEGSMLWLVITQDGTGGREVTWGANFDGSPDIRMNASEVTRLLFVAEGDGLWHLASGGY